MKRIFGVLLFVALTTIVAAEEPLVIKLWPDGVPEDNGLEEVYHPDERVYFSVTDPEMWCFFPGKGKANGQAMVICPGGSYGGLAFGHEGLDVGQWLSERGITAVVLKYRMPNGNYEIACKDVRRAIEFTKSKASEWGYDAAKVGVMGFSAGGHLASMAATHFIAENDRPAFAVLFYPVISMKEELTHADTRRNLIGEGYNADLVKEFSNELKITKATPPTFIVFNTNDRLVNPRNVTSFYDSLVANGVSAEMHIFHSGGHGYGWRDSFKYNDEVRASLMRWLGELK